MTPYKILQYWREMSYQAMHTHRRLAAIYKEHELSYDQCEDYIKALSHTQVARLALKTVEDDCLNETGDRKHLRAWLGSVKKQVGKANSHADKLPRPTPRQVTN